MTPPPLNRKARRAAERAERKAIEHNSLEPATLQSETQLAEPRPSGSGLTPGRLAANRANAQLSTGPKSESGKINSSKNAKDEAAFLSEPKIQQVTALTGRTVLLPEDDAGRYENHLNQYRKAYQPVGERECELVQSLADTTWRLDRIPGLEEAIYARGCSEFAAEVSDLDPRSRSASLHMRTYLAYERQLRNLNLQEMRLHRLREKLIAEIKQLQKEREQKEKDDLAIAAKLYVAAKHDHKPFDPADYGFEFSTADLEGYLHGQRAAFLTEKAMIGGQRH
ncbi:MAG TPA: hypothetical protein VHZ07_12415 [Bryobacteraceae bacterium]|jgi:hypothetical protein|nr:hypothetical protein [Bryobacteraceae bacterium]